MPAGLKSEIKRLVNAIRTRGPAEVPGACRLRDFLYNQPLRIKTAEPEIRAAAPETGRSGPGTAPGNLLQRVGKSAIYAGNVK